MRLRLATFCILLFWAGSARAADPHKLVVIAIDGFDARYLRDADKLHLKIPVLRKLMSHGAVADGVVGVIPNDSWAANTTLVTGQSPAVHLVVGGGAVMQSPNSKTLWQAAREAHRKTALLYWPASVQAEADWNCPQFWEGRPAVDLPFDPIAQKCTPGFVDRVARAYPAFAKAQWNDETALSALRYLLQVEKPDLSLVHIDDLEGEERETGALSVYSREVLENDDDLIGQALRKLEPSTLVAIVSDHGFDTERYIVRPKILVDSRAVEVRYGLIGATDQKTAAALRKLIGNKKTGIAREIPMGDVKRVTPAISGWIAAFSTAPGYIASDSAKGLGVGPGNHKGVHELWPARPEFRSVFVLSGEGVKPGHIGEISMLDIAPTFAQILGIKIPAAGTSFWPKLMK